MKFRFSESQIHDNPINTPKLSSATPFSTPILSHLLSTFHSIIILFFPITYMYFFEIIVSIQCTIEKIAHKKYQIDIETAFYYRPYIYSIDFPFLH